MACRSLVACRSLMAGMSRIDGGHEHGLGQELDGELKFDGRQVNG